LQIEYRYAKPYSKGKENKSACNRDCQQAAENAPLFIDGIKNYDKTYCRIYYADTDSRE